MRIAIVLFALLFVYSSATAEPKKLMITIECDSDPSKLLDLAQGPQYQGCTKAFSYGRTTCAHRTTADCESRHKNI